MSANTESMVPRGDRKKENRYDVNVVNQGLLIDYFQPEPKQKFHALVAKVRVYPTLSVLINLEESSVIVWGARRGSYKARPGGYTEDRTVPTVSGPRPPDVEELSEGRIQSVLFHFEANHVSRSGLNTFLVVTNPIQIHIERFYVSVMYARYVRLKASKPQDDVVLRDDTEYTPDFRSDELFLTQQEEERRLKVLPFSNTAS